MKKILALVSSVRRRGNTSRLTDAFLEGAAQAGCEIEKIYLADLEIAGCLGCGVCQRNGGTCVQHDDMISVSEKLLAADAIVFASPVYFYTWNAQMKTVLDRTYALMSRLADKDFYLLATGAASSTNYQDHIVQAFELYVGCFEGNGCKTAGVVIGVGTNAPDDIEGTPALAIAREMGACC